VVENVPGRPVTFASPLSHINVHVRDGSIILLHAKPAYTIEETRQGPYSLLVSQSSQGLAFGTAYIDDGISNPPGPNRILKFLSTSNEVVISAEGDFTIEQKLRDITVLGVNYEPTSVTLNGRMVGNWTYAQRQNKLVAHEIDADLNVPLSLEWVGGLDFQVDGVWLRKASTNSSNVE
jgi:alpha-glucosidase